MKKLTVVVAIVLASIFSFSCSKESTPAVPPTPAPTVDFSYSGTTAPAPALIGFSSNVTNGTTMFGILEIMVPLQRQTHNIVIL